MNNLNKLLSDGVYVIPKNQRGYSWTNKEIDDLFVDMELMGDKSHYLGTVIVTKKEQFQTDDDRTPTVRYILEDGQQRLTTLLLLLNAVRERLIEIDGKVTPESEILGKLIAFKEGDKRLRIENENKILNDCLSHLVRTNPSYAPHEKTPPMRLMEGAVKHISKKLEKYKTREDVLSLRNKVNHQVMLIQVDLGEMQIDRYLTFDAINSRGLPLTEFEKIKNFCILVAERRSLNVKPENLWFKAIESLEKFGVGNRSNENGFISELYSVFHGVNVGATDVHNQFVKEYRVLLEGSNGGKEARLISFITYWETYANAFGFINSNNKARYYGNLCSHTCGKWLDALDHLGLQTITKKILTAAYLNCTAEEDEFESIVNTCEKYTFRMHALSKYRVDKNSAAILELANQVLLSTKTATDIRKRLSELMLKDDPAGEVFVKLISGELNYKNWNYIYYFLYEYELSLTPSTSRPIDYLDKKESIEHILPQSHRDNDKWQSHWRDGLKAERWVHRIGNLVLTLDNPRLGRKFIDKKLFDEDSDYYYSHDTKSTNSERYIKKYTDGSEWREKNILQRELDLVKFAVKRWTIDSYEPPFELIAPSIFKENIPQYEDLNFS
ncbi:DUF262 domain-containing protein [Pseudoalteromonas atlantica]|uniref:DUF262 domain-containing protein n=1 Tax=Pseudoalteromonas atlantica TaxID=288 RepID=UPI0037357C68